MASSPSSHQTHIPLPSDPGGKPLDHEAHLSLVPIHVVTHASQLPAEFLNPSPEKQFVIGLDCEGVDLCRHGTLCIMQLSFPDAIYLVDAIQGGEMLMKDCKPALESSYITKVIHDCKRDSEALYFQFGIKLHNVVDTQIAYSLIEEQEGRTRSSDDYISFVGLLADPRYCGIIYVVVKVAVQYMRRVILKKAKFDIMDLNCLKVAPKTFIPALFGHASEDKFIQPHHSDLIFKSYAGDKNIIKFDGDHNSSRPQFYYDSVSIFFYNVLHPPQISTAYSSKLEKYYDLGDLKVGAGIDESLLYEIITGLRSARTDAASSSSAAPSMSTTKSVGELLSDIAPTSVVDSILNEVSALTHDQPPDLQDEPNGQNDECCSYTSSNRESWGRCSSLGGSDEESSADCTAAENSHQMTVKALATPLRSIQGDPSKEEKKKKKTPQVQKPKREKFEKLEALSKRLRLCILKRVNHRRHRSS